MTTTLYTDIAILGGGICGLWTLNVLRRHGYRALLLEKNALGSGQTIASQGMIHGGVKYALDGFTTESSETIATMPDLWRACLAGEGPVDLRDVKLLSEDYYLFSDGRLSSRLAAFFGSRSLRGRITPVRRPNYPASFANPAFKGSLYRLQDLVLDTGSLLSSLYDKTAGRVFKGRAALVGAADKAPCLVLEDGVRLVTRYCILAAGEGNETILRDAGLQGIPMQRRPLHQVMVKSPHLPRLYAHAVSLTSGATPRVTITTHRARDGENVWYLGGALAESGVDRGESQQIRFARDELGSLLPWVSLEHSRWVTLRINRAEPADPEGARPGHPFLGRMGNVIVCWPTKLTLAPLLASELLDLLGKPRAGDEALPELPAPDIATPPWERLF